MSRLILACGTSVFHPHKRRRSFCSPECFLCSDTDWQEQRRGGKGKERKGSAEARSAQNPASEHKPLNRIFKKGFFVIWWRRWMTECFFKMSFKGNIQMFSHLRSSDTKCCFVTQLTQGSRSHLCTHRLTNPAHAIQAALLLLLLLLLGLVINDLFTQRFCGYMSYN